MNGKSFGRVYGWTMPMGVYDGASAWKLVIEPCRFPLVMTSRRTPLRRSRTRTSKRNIVYLRVSWAFFAQSCDWLSPVESDTV